MDRLNAELLDRLAAEYVLGTLGAAARRRFAALLQRSNTAAAAVRDWEQRTAALAGSVAPLAPSAGLWERVNLAVQAAPGRITAPAARGSR